MQHDKDLYISVFQVGGMYDPRKTRWDEGTNLHFSGAFHFLIFHAQPTPAEIEAVHNGPEFIGLLPGRDLFFFLCHMKGVKHCYDSPFTWWLTPETISKSTPEFSAADSCEMLHTFLIDANTGIIRAIAVGNLSARLTEILHAAICDQATRAWCGLEKYKSQIKEAYLRWPNPNDMEKYVRNQSGDVKCGFMVM